MRRLFACLPHPHTKLPMSFISDQSCKAAPCHWSPLMIPPPLRASQRGDVAEVQARARIQVADPFDQLDLFRRGQHPLEPIGGVNLALPSFRTTRSCPSADTEHLRNPKGGSGPI